MPFRLFARDLLLQDAIYRVSGVNQVDGLAAGAARLLLRQLEPEKAWPPGDGPLLVKGNLRLGRTT